MHNMSKQFNRSSINTQPCNAMWTPKSQRMWGIWQESREMEDTTFGGAGYLTSLICLQKRRLKARVEVFRVAILSLSHGESRRLYVYKHV